MRRNNGPILDLPKKKTFTKAINLIDNAAPSFTNEKVKNLGSSGNIDL